MEDMATDAKEAPWEINEKGFPYGGAIEGQLLFLLHYAILAPSARNTQPWKFRIHENAVNLYADRSHWVKMADKDQRELFVSLGCALENLLVAARHFGFASMPEYFPEHTSSELAARVIFSQQPNPSEAGMDDSLFDAILNRQSNHHGFKPQPIPESAKQSLLSCMIEEGISLYLIDEPAVKQRLDELAVLGDAMELADPAYLQELYGNLEADRAGLDWLMAKAHRLAVGYMNLKKPGECRDSEMLAEAPLLGLLATVSNDPQAQVKAGQAFERIWLKASSLGISLQALTQELQLAELKEELVKITGVSNLYPQQFFRMGYAQQTERDFTTRRPVEAVLIGG